jgi:GDP-4-dehydro-6-deoxy-D-mannose reductase
MTVLVTGARGGFAKAFIPKLAESVRGDVLSVVREKAQQPNDIQCDLSDRTAIEDLIRKTKPQVIYHLAGSFAGNFETDVLVNVHSSKWIFDELISSKLDCRVVVFGSAAEYGLVAEASNPVPETHPLNPVSIYGLTKVMQTQISSFYASTRGVDVVVARVFNLAVQGLSQRLFYGRLISLIDSYKRREIEKMTFGNLEAIRDYIDLDGATAQILAIADKGLKGGVYNVGSGVPVRMRDLLCRLLVENNIPLNCFECAPESQKRGADVPVIYADITKVSALVGE